MFGKLYIVSTPIGNLEDVTIRALKTLRETKFIFAEDTRSALKLMHYHDIPTRDKAIISFFEGNEESRHFDIISKLQLGENVIIVSESGTPLISDPGFKLVREVLKLGISVESIPGPTALITALTISGLPTNAFMFFGFFPKKMNKVLELLKSVKASSENISQLKTYIFYESPHRLLKDLALMREVFGNINIVVARELTKIHEEVVRCDIDSAILYFTQNPPRGEFVILFSLEK